MAHFALIDENNVVTNVVVVADEHEDRGQEYLSVDCGLGGTWIQTSYNHNIRKQYASIGGSYDPVKDIFIVKQPYESWSLDENGDWQPPVAYPEGQMAGWNESTQQWDILDPDPAEEEAPSDP